MDMASGIVEAKMDRAWGMQLRKGIPTAILDMYVEDTHEVHASGLRTFVQLLNASLLQTRGSMKERVDRFMHPVLVDTTDGLLVGLHEMRREYEKLSAPSMGRYMLDSEDGYTALEYLLSNWGTVRRARCGHRLRRDWVWEDSYNAWWR